ncbi:hypothetical protein [Pedobacter endophyticus]|uniref:Outer membrane protein beta-barrel domain-containing protein n=1 Tax=Pedobacter endophyticus TaxID=2789740 RepID=A0A7U3Q4A6_9SPHI|nr:hypothetical protein [Pedobacter endophyticus]QPH38341.1 hypothetical protein IZT61_14730 [Pedobacter endophyticus]
MNKFFIGISLILCTIIARAQTSGDYNYSIGVRAYTLVELPKILNQTSNQTYTSTYGNGILFKFNDNQISYRIGGNYYRNDVSFDNTCANCEIANGKVTDYSFKIGFEKNFNYSKIQPYFAFDLGFRSNRFSGTLSPKGTGFSSKTAEATKNGLVLAPVIGVKVNILPQLLLFAESNLDFYFSYERQDITEPSGSGRTVNTYRKLETLLNPVSAGLQFNLNRRN